MTPATCATCGCPLGHDSWATSICRSDCLDLAVEAGLARQGHRPAAQLTLADAFARATAPRANRLVTLDRFTAEA